MSNNITCCCCGKQLDTCDVDTAMSIGWLYDPTEDRFACTPECASSVTGNTMTIKRISPVTDGVPCRKTRTLKPRVQRKLSDEEKAFQAAKRKLV